MRNYSFVCENTYIIERYISAYPESPDNDLLYTPGFMQVFEYKDSDPVRSAIHNILSGVWDRTYCEEFSTGLTPAEERCVCNFVDWWKKVGDYRYNIVFVVGNFNSDDYRCYIDRSLV